MNSRISKNDKKEQPKELHELLKSIVSSLVETKTYLDKTSFDIANEYSKNKYLSSLEIPYFTLPRVAVKLKYAVAEIRNSKVFVYVNSDHLKELTDGPVCEIEIELNQGKIKKPTEL